jgi:hypothetical protein
MDEFLSWNIGAPMSMLFAVIRKSEKPKIHALATQTA